jgi:hypothetical protein
MNAVEMDEECMKNMHLRKTYASTTCNDRETAGNAALDGNRDILGCFGEHYGSRLIRVAKINCNTAISVIFFKMYEYSQALLAVA